MTTPVIATPQTATRTTWVLDPTHTHIEFSAKHMMVTTVKGHFRAFEGVIHADEANPANSSVEVTIDAASLTTNLDQRDAHLRSADFLDVETYPKLTFKSKRVEYFGPSNFKVIGDLTIRNITHEVALNAEFSGKQKSPWGTENAGFSAATSIDRRDWGLTWNTALEAGGWLVGDQVKITIEVEAVKR